MNTGVAIVVAVGLVGAAALIAYRMTGGAQGSACAKLAAVDPKAAAACELLGALGIDAEDIAAAPGKFVGGIQSTPSAFGNTVTSAFGIGGKSDPFICGVYKATGKPRSEWPADVQRQCPP